MLFFLLTIVLSEDPKLTVQDSPPAPVVVRSLSMGSTTVSYSNHPAGKPLSSVLCRLSSANTFQPDSVLPSGKTVRTHCPPALYVRT